MGVGLDRYGDMSAVFEPRRAGVCRPEDVVDAIDAVNDAAEGGPDNRPGDSFVWGLTESEASSSDCREVVCVPSGCGRGPKDPFRDDGVCAPSIGLWDSGLGTVDDQSASRVGGEVTGGGDTGAGVGGAEGFNPFDKAGGWAFSVATRCSGALTDMDSELRSRVRLESIAVVPPSGRSTTCALELWYDVAAVYCGEGV